MRNGSIVGGLIDRAKWKWDRRKRWVADLRREAASRQEETLRREVALRSEIQRSEERQLALDTRLSELETAMRVVSASLLEAAEVRLRAIEDRLASLRAATDTLERQLALHEHLFSSALAPALSAPIPQCDSARDAPHVSIIMPVFNRRRFLGSAIDSVSAQEFQSWELIVVDDGSSDDIKSVVARCRDDPRIRCIQQPRLGAAAARNAGLMQAKGEIITYLDSDNLWYPRYLTDMVAALEANPDADLAYGVLVSEVHGLGERCLLFKPFDRDNLLKANFIDMNVLAHRSKLFAQLGGFDESLDRLIDWDLVLRYSENHNVLGVRTLGARYRVIDDIRITDTALAAPNAFAIGRKWYPPRNLETHLRVLYVVWHYPQLSETYIETEIQCLRRWGVHVEVWRAEDVAVPYPSSVPIHTGAIEDAVREVEPDLIHVHWLGFALTQDAAFTALGLPVTVRLHGFDTTRDGLEALLSKPWLRTIYAFPAQAELLGRVDPRMKVVPAAFDSTLFRPNRNKDRRLVVRAGTALPSKDLMFMFEIAKKLPDFHFVYAGITAKYVEPFVDELIAKRDRLHSPAEFRLNLPRAEAADLIGRAGIYLHTINPEGAPDAAPLGMPVSIAEAMATGAFVMVRHSSEFADYVGDAGRTYREVDEAARIIAETETWTDEDWKKAQDRSIERAFKLFPDEIVYRTILEDWAGGPGL